MNAIKLCKSLVVMLLFVFQAHSQFTILENTVVQVGSDIDFISQSNVTNNGTFNFGESTFIFDANLTNTGTINMSEATLKLGTVNSTGSYVLNFSEAQPIDVRQLILESNSASFTADVTSAGSLRVIGSLESISGTLNANEKIIIWKPLRR